MPLPSDAMVWFVASDCETVLLTVRFIKPFACFCFNPYKPSVYFVGHRQTVQTQSKRRKLWRLIRVSTVC